MGLGGGNRFFFSTVRVFRLRDAVFFLFYANPSCYMAEKLREWGPVPGRGIVLVACSVRAAGNWRSSLALLPSLTARLTRRLYVSIGLACHPVFVAWIVLRIGVRLRWYRKWGRLLTSERFAVPVHLCVNTPTHRSWRFGSASASGPDGNLGKTGWWRSRTFCPRHPMMTRGDLIAYATRVGVLLELSSVIGHRAYGGTTRGGGGGGGGGGQREGLGYDSDRPSRWLWRLTFLD